MFVLKKRKYNWLDMWRMPFSCAPASTLAVTAQKLSTALANVFQVIVVARFLDGAIQSAVSRSIDRETVVWFGWLLLIVGWKRVSYHVGNLFTNYVNIHGNEQISAELTAKRDRMEYYLLENPEIEELSNRLTGKLQKNLHWNLQWFLNLFAINIPRIAGVLLIITGYVWWLSLVVLGLTIPMFIFSLKDGKKVYRTVEEAAVYERRHKYLSGLLTGREATEERSLFGYTGQLNVQWHHQYEEAVKQDIRSEKMFMGNSLRGMAINSLLSAVVVLIMIPLTASGRLTVGIFISLVTSMYDLIDIMGNSTAKAVFHVAMAQEYMKDFTTFAALPEREETAGEELHGIARTVSARVQKNAADMAADARTREDVPVVVSQTREEATTATDRIQKDVSAASDRTRAENAAAAGQARGNVPAAADQSQGGLPKLETLEFCHVTFRYPGTDTDILKDFCMKLENGRHYAVVGENGAGKTTLIKLLTGLYREYEGEILYNSMEMRTFPREEWFRIFSCVFQDFARYYLSVEENICLGTGNMDFEETEGREQKRKRLSRMESAARRLDIHDAISELKYGYGTRLGKLDEDSLDLSGGQWQRVAMARALMNDAPLLLLDEPTAALDPVSESRLYEEFGAISRNRTTIFISHRLGSVKLSDHIFLIKDGCVREQGSHQELMERQGIYAHMYETQQSWYQQDIGDQKDF